MSDKYVVLDSFITEAVADSEQCRWTYDIYAACGEMNRLTQQLAEANAEIEKLNQIVNDRTAKDYTIEAYRDEIEQLRDYKRRVEAQAEDHTEYVLAQINQELEAEVKFEREKNESLWAFVAAAKGALKEKDDDDKLYGVTMALHGLRQAEIDETN